MQPAHALCFDLDETLLDGAGFLEATRVTCQRIAASRPGLDPEVLLAANGRVFWDYFREVEEPWVQGRVSGAEVTLEAWRRTLAACGHGDEETVRRATETHLRLARESHRLFDDARALLEALDGRLPLALVTNGAADTQGEKIEALGIRSHFRGIAISGELGAAKPNPAIFAHALERLGVEPGASVWHIGDNLQTDVAGAQAAGLTAVWLNRKGVLPGDGDPEPEHVITSLAELAELLTGPAGGKSSAAAR